MLLVLLAVAPLSLLWLVGFTSEGSHSSCLVFSALVYDHRKYHSLKFSSLYPHFLRVHSPVSFLYNKFLDLNLKGVLVTFISFSITLLKKVFIVVVTMVISNILLARHDMVVTCHPSSWEAEADR